MKTLTVFILCLCVLSFLVAARAEYSEETENEMDDANFAEMEEENDSNEHTAVFKLGDRELKVDFRRRKGDQINDQNGLHSSNVPMSSVRIRGVYHHYEGSPEEDWNEPEGAEKDQEDQEFSAEDAKSMKSQIGELKVKSPSWAPEWSILSSMLDNWIGDDAEVNVNDSEIEDLDEDEGEDEDEAEKETEAEMASCPGSCMNINTRTCRGYLKRGLCPGPSNIRCCVLKGVGNTCYYQGRRGSCIDTQSTSCSGSKHAVSGKCPGPRQVKCCVSKSSGGSGSGGSKPDVSVSVQRFNGKTILLPIFEGYRDNVFGVMPGAYHSSSIIKVYKGTFNRCYRTSGRIACHVSYVLRKYVTLCNHGRCPDALSQYCKFRGSVWRRIPSNYSCYGEYNSVCFAWEKDGHNCNDDSLFQQRLVLSSGYRSGKIRGECVGRCASRAPSCLGRASTSLPSRMYVS